METSCGWLIIRRQILHFENFKMEVEAPAVMEACDLVLVSSSGEKVNTCAKYMCSKEAGSKLIQTLLGKAGDAESSDEEDHDEIPFPDLSTQTLNYIVEFCKHHYRNPIGEIPIPLTSNDLSEYVDAWDVAFIDKPKAELFDIVNASNNLDIPSLLRLGAAKIATFIRGRKPEEIMKEFEVTEEFTEEKKEEILAENPWIEEL